MLVSVQAVSSGYLSVLILISISTSIPSVQPGSGESVGGKVVGDSVGIGVGMRVGFPVGLRVGVGCATHVPNDFVSVDWKFPPVAAELPFTRTSYEPLPYSQQIPSLNSSVIVKSYAPVGTQYLFECKVLVAVYWGLLMTAPDPHLLVSVQTVSSGYSSVVILISISIPLGHGVGGTIPHATAVARGPIESVLALLTIAFLTWVGFHDGFAERMDAAIPATSEGRE